MVREQRHAPVKLANHAAIAKVRIPATGRIDTSPEAIAQIHQLASQWQALVVADLAIDPAMRGGRR
jgi:hypothetical protein